VAVIDSPQNPRIQAARALRERRERLDSGQTIVDGARECRRAIEAHVPVVAAFVCRELIRTADAEAAVLRLTADGAEIVEVSERAHDRLAFGNRGDGLVVVVRTPSTSLDALRLGPTPLLLVTEDVEKPGNLGAILRTADGSGCDAVIAIGGTDLYNPNVIRASVGTVFTVPVATASAVEVRSWLSDHDIRTLAARVEAAPRYSEVDLTGPLAFVLGSESDGLSSVWQDAEIEGVSLPMHGVADSLNVSVAAAVLAFEARRQRDLRP
jgi:TrmH family RNA methyltransferase